MGEVYLAEDTRLGRKVALKLLPPRLTRDTERLRRFEREAREASALNHPNIVTVYDIGQTDEIHFMATEYVEGKTLRHRMGEVPIPIGEALEIGIQIASALGAAHEAGIIHRDIKPENVMLRPDGMVKVLDFGLAKLTEERAGERERGRVEERGSERVGIIPPLPFSSTGVVMGTPHYMSPEQAQGLRVDMRSDIFSLGVVLYEMINGRVLFDTAATADTDVNTTPLASTASAAPAELERILGRALSHNRGNRYQTIEDFLNDLKNLKQRLDRGTQVVPKRPVFAWQRLAILAVTLLFLAVNAYIIRGHLSPIKEASAERVNLAVLPFHTLNAPEEAHFLGIAIPDAIIMRLAHVRQIRTRPTGAVLRYENQNINLQEVAQALSCDYLLTGVVLKAGEQLHVSVQLIQAKDSSTLWGNRYDVTRQDLLGLQDSIAERVSAALKIRMTAAERERFYRRYTGNAAAYELYLQGRAHLRRAGREEKLAAVKAFENALRLEPQYALAHAGLAAACGSMRHGRAPQSEVNTWEERAKQAARRAIQLDPELAEAYEALAAVYRYTDFDWEQTFENSRKALDLNPNLDEPHYYLARTYYHLGLLELVEQEVRVALEINPENRIEATQLRIIASLYGSRFAEAVAFYEELIRLSGEVHPRWPLVYFYYGERKHAEEMLTKIIRDGSLGPGTELEGKAILASILAARGARAEAEAILQEVTSASESFHHASYSVGAAYAQLGDKAKARLWLARAEQTGFPCYPWYRDDPLLHPLRGDPEFQRFMADLKNSWEAAKARYGH